MTVFKNETLFPRLGVIFVVLSTERENSEYATDCGFPFSTVWSFHCYASVSLFPCCPAQKLQNRKTGIWWRENGIWTSTSPHWGTEDLAPLNLNDKAGGKRSAKYEKIAASEATFWTEQQEGHENTHFRMHTFKRGRFCNSLQSQTQLSIHQGQEYVPN